MFAKQIQIFSPRNFYSVRGGKGRRQNTFCPNLESKHAAALLLALVDATAVLTPADWWQVGDRARDVESTTNNNWSKVPQGWIM